VDFSGLSTFIFVTLPLSFFFPPIRFPLAA